MKILHLSGDLEDNGGILSVIRNLKTASEPWGWEHVVLVNRSYVEKRSPPLTYRYSHHLVNESEYHLRLLWGAWRAMPEFRDLLQQEKFDILHAHTRGALPLSLLLAATRQTPIVYTCHTLGTRTWLYRAAARLKNIRLVLLTRNMADHYGLQPCPPRINLISACCADRFFEEPLAVERYEPGQGGPLKLAAFGNVVRWKNWRLILEAIQQLPEPDRRQVQFSLWGPTASFPDSERYGQELKEFVARNHMENEVHLRGSAPSVAQAMRETHWLVHPTPNEPCSVSIMEALAVGLPALVAAGGGSTEIVRHGQNGLHFSPGSATDLADKLRTLLHDPVSVLPAEKIRESVRSRSATSVAEQYRAVYEEATA